MTRLRTLAAAAGLAGLLLPVGVAGLGLDATIRRTAVASGFASPLDIAFAPGDRARMFVVEQGGRIRIVRDGLVVPTPFLDLSSKTTGGGERGLLGLAFHPDYESNRRLFVFYTRSGDGALIVERYEREADHPERVDAASARPLLAIPHPGAANHNGGKLAFGHDGYLYVGTGDGGGSNDPFNNGQAFGTRLGKMLRIDVDVESPPYYAIPPSNPFTGMTCNGAGTGTCPEIWSLGLRNPFRFSFDRVTGDLFIGDVGQGAREEVDFEPFGSPGGRNYGWRILEGTICTPAIGSPCTPPANYVPPIFDYDRNQGQSITGGFRYRGSRVPELAGAYLYADFGSGRLWAATPNGGGGWTPQQLLLNAGGVSAFGEDHDGELYVTNYFNGTVYRLDPVDTDGDLLPDWWELAHFGSTTGANANADPDADLHTNLTEYLAGSDPDDAQSVPLASPYVPPEITSGNALSCVVGAACSMVVAATGVPSPAVARTGALPAGLSYNASTRTISGTPAAGTSGTYVQTITASNGIAPAASQALTIVVAAGCGGFADVASTDLHCASVEWLRNRGITLGCTASTYCADDAVSRASMALFLDRLGSTATPQIAFTERSESVSLDARPVVCAGTTDIAPATHPRTVHAQFAVSLDAAGALVAGATLVASRNAGATWEPVSLTRMRIEASGAGWRSTNGQGVLAIEVGDAVRFGVLLEREGGAAAVNAVRCNVAALVINRDGATTPRDARMRP